MSASRVAWFGAVGAVVAWGSKAVAIGVAGGLDKSPAEVPLFLLGLVCAVSGGAALGVALTHPRPAWLRAVAGVLAVVALLTVAGVGGAASEAAQPADAGWVWGEVNLWVSAVALLGAVWVSNRRGHLGAGSTRDRS